MSNYRINVTLVNEDEGVRFSEWDEDPADYYWNAIREDGTLDMGRLFREMRSEYGRCQSSVYVDTKSRGTIKTGWYFVKRDSYEGHVREGAPETYLRGAWVTVSEVVEEARPEERRSVEV